MTTMTSIEDIVKTARNKLDEANNTLHKPSVSPVDEQTLRKLEIFIASNQKSIAQIELLLGILLSVMREKEVISENELFELLGIENSKMDMSISANNRDRRPAKYRYHT
ncbi:MAG: hypothetical protein AAGB35_04515 [Pseudomonadota bacterium]